MPLKKICVFCGSSYGRGDAFTIAAKKLANAFVNHNIELVYGGSRFGIMGILADTCLEKNGKVIGVMPKLLVDREAAHNGLHKLLVVDSMHERKATMEKESDAFIAMPGGLGTTEELFEMWTWGQLGIHKKPLALYNVSGFFDKLLEFMDVQIENGFLEKTYKEMVVVSHDPEEIIKKLQSYTHPKLDKAFEALKKFNSVNPKRT